MDLWPPGALPAAELQAKAHSSGPLAAAPYWSRLLAACARLRASLKPGGALARAEAAHAPRSVRRLWPPGGQAEAPEPHPGAPPAR